MQQTSVDPNMAGDQCLHPSSATFNNASCCHFVIFALWWDKAQGSISEGSRSIGPRAFMMVFQVRKNSGVTEMLFLRLERGKTCLASLGTQLAMLPVDLLLLFDLISLCC